MISVYYQHPHSISLSRNDDSKVWESLRKYLNNKDDNTHKSKALKSERKTNEKKNSCTVSKLNKQNIYL